MIIKLDWLSFSFKRPVGSTEQASVEHMLMVDALHKLLGDVGKPFVGYDLWTPGKGRAPYEQSWHHPRGGVVIFWHSHLDHALCEVSGKGFDWLTQEAWYREWLGMVKERVTRLDVACDILSGLDPILFAEQRDHARFRSHSEFVSESGTTAYVGSRTSNRYARVYRYNPPHERARFLRVEHVVKAEDAKATLGHVLMHGLESTAKALGDGFGWSHPQWRVEAPSAGELSVFRAERKEGKTLFWLADTVAPLLLRLESEGIIDIDEWVKNHLTSKRSHSHNN